MGRRKGSRVMTDQTRDVLGFFTAHRYARTSFVRAFFPHRGEHGLVDQLRRLRELGLLFQPPESDDFYRYYNSDFIHSITPEGLRVAEAEHSVWPQVTRVHRRKPERGERFEDVKVRNFAHAMMICDTLLSIEIACRQEGIEFIPWETIQGRMPDPSDTSLRYSFTHQGKHYQDALIPDGMFGIRYPNGKESFFALECENENPVSRTNLRQNSWKKKAIGYADILERGEYRDQFDVRNLWVLVVVPSLDKSHHQQEVTEETIGPHKHMLFSQVPEHKFMKRAPKPFPELLTTPLRKAGFPDEPIYDRERGERMKADAQTMEEGTQPGTEPGMD